MSKQLPFISQLYSTVFYISILLKTFTFSFKKNISSLTLLTLFLFSQALMATTPVGEWKLYKELNGVKIFTSKEECHDFANGTHYEYVILKFENNTNTAKKISWSENLYYNGVCNGCDGNTDLPLFQVELKAKEVIQGGCGSENGDTFRIFNRFLNYKDKQELTKFELTNISISDK